MQDTRLDQFIKQSPGHNGIQSIKRQTNAMIRDPILGIVIGTDLFATVSATNLRLTTSAHLRELFFHLQLIKTGFKDFEGLVLVFVLRLFILDRD
jgi:hypothetical protein